MKTFARFRFDERDQTLWQGTDRVRLTPKAAALLHCLLDAQGGWVGKAAILAAVWPDTHVHPDNVKVLVREIRVALGDDSRQPRFVRCEPRRGYAFVADVTEASSWAFLDRTPELMALVEAVGPLDETQVRRYLQTRFGGSSLPRLSPALHTVCGGDLSLMVTVVDTLMTSGIIRQAGGRWRPEIEVETIAAGLHDTLRKTLTRQLEPLQRAEREVLELAALTGGREFGADDVARAGAMDPRTVATELAELARRAFIVPAGVRAHGRPGPTRYRFRHPLLAEILVNRAPALLHILAARRLETVAETEPALA